MTLLLMWLRQRIQEYLKLLAISVKFSPKISYHKASPSLSLACMSATKKPAWSLSVTCTLWLFVLNAGGFSDSFGASTTWTETRVWWLRGGSPWSAARIYGIYSIRGSSDSNRVYIAGIPVWICCIIKSESETQFDVICVIPCKFTSISSRSNILPSYASVSCSFTQFHKNI